MNFNIDAMPISMFNTPMQVTGACSYEECKAAEKRRLEELLKKEASKRTKTLVNFR